MEASRSGCRCASSAATLAYRPACLARETYFVITAGKTCQRGPCRTSRASHNKQPGGSPVSNVRVLATDLEFPEGPVVMPDGSVVLVEIRGKRLTRVYPNGRKEVVAVIPGGPNGAALGPDGKMYICNNGGFSWIPTG